MYTHTHIYIYTHFFFFLADLLAIYCFYFKFYFLFILISFYCLCYYNCPYFPPLPQSHSTPIPLAIHTPLFISMDHACNFFGYSISYTLYPHGYSVTIYLFFLMPSPLHPFPNTPLPSGNHQNTPVSMVLSLFLFAIFF